MAFRELRAEEWRDEIESGLEYRKRFGLEELWSRLEAIYYNTHDSMSNDGPNIFLSQGDAMLSTLSTPSPRISVKPRIPEAVAKAPLVEALDNALIEDLEVSEECETAALHAYLFGRGIIKVGYDSEWGYDPEQDLGGSLKLGMTLTQVDKKGKRLIEHGGVVPGMPWAKAVMPHDIVVPWGVKDIKNAPWIAHRVCRHIDDLKADPKYENVRDLNPQISMEDFVYSYRSTTKPMRKVNTERDAEYIEFYEIHDRRTGKIFCVTWDTDKFLRNDLNSLQIDNKLPFAGISFVPRTRAFWTTPDVFYLFYGQMELSDIARQRTKQRRLSVLKMLADDDAISDEELEKLLSPDVGAVAKTKSGRKLNEAVAVLNNQNNNQMLALEEEHIRANLREQMGFSRNQVGEYTGGRKTATEVGTVERSSQLRMSRRGLRMKRLYEDTIQLINGMVFKNWTLPRAVRVLGPSRGEEWMSLSGAALQSKYSYSVEFVDENEMESMKLQALQLYSLLSNDPSVDPVELRNYLMSRVNDPAFERIFNADVRAEVLKRKLSSGDGNLQSGGAGGRDESAAAGLQQMLQAHGQEGLNGTKGLLAGGRIGA